MSETPRAKRPRTLAEKLLIYTAVFLAVAALFAWIVRDDWSRTAVSSAAPSRGAVLPELTADGEIAQTFTVAADELNALWLDCSQWAAPADVPVRLALSAADSPDAAPLLSWEVLPDAFEPDALTCLTFPKTVAGRRGQVLRLTLNAGGGLSFWGGTSIKTGRFSAVMEEIGELTVNGEAHEGSLVLRQDGVNLLQAMRFFWPVAAALWACGLAVILHTERCRKAGKPSLVLQAEMIWERYAYLLKTLVVRDFRVKYKASVLGVLWSFLNPLLMTFVYYLVFSTLFHSDIENFTAYLMSGIIIFNYFSDATNLGLHAIVGNAALITKVYMPKFIYPLSKVLSSAVNLVISLIPLMAVMLLSGVVPHKSLLLLPLALGFLLVFCAGMALLLSAAMVFFRDIQFLWGVMLTIWNFLTPIFYPESIIPAALQGLYHCNPLYQFIFFVRSITIGGISPTPITYLYCLIASFGTLAVGWAVFRRTQDRFVLYL